MSKGVTPIKQFEPVSEKIRFAGEIVSIYETTLLGPDQNEIIRDVVRHPGAVCVVPLVGESVRMIRQYRSATNKYLLEIPAGKRDLIGESPEETAHRELIEEVGLKAGKLTLLGEFYNSPGFCDEYSYCYLAQNCVSVPDNRQGVEEEHMEIVHIDLQDVQTMIDEKDIVDAKSIIGLMLAKEHVR